MRLFYIILVIFFILTNGINADTEIQVLENLKKGGNLIFIRHAYAPGGGDPDNFDFSDCSTQRNLSESGRKQAKNIGIFFKDNQIPIDKVFSSEWCRCKATAQIAFGKYETKILNDGWTDVTKDKSLSAQFEHTVGITKNGYEIFTQSKKFG